MLKMVAVTGRTRFNGGQKKGAKRWKAAFNIQARYCALFKVAGAATTAAGSVVSL